MERVIEKGISPTRTFGVEFEVDITRRARAPEADRYDRSRYGLFSFLRDNDVQVTRPAGYHSGLREPGFWRMEEDGSITGEADAIEVISPVLAGESGKREVERVLGLLWDFGCDANRSTGMHIHWWIGDFTDKSLKVLYQLYYEAQPTISLMLPPSRRENGYCQEVNIPYEQLVSTDAAPSRVLPRYSSGHNVALNFGRYVTNGTVEFRQHSGTVEYKKFQAWWALTGAMVEEAKGRQYKRRSRGDVMTLKKLFKQMNFVTWTRNDGRRVPCSDFEQARKTLRKRYEKFAGNLTAEQENRLNRRIERRSQYYAEVVEARCETNRSNSAAATQEVQIEPLARW